MNFQETKGGDDIACEEQRDGGPECAAPAPIEGESDEIMREDGIAKEAREVVEGAIGIPETVAEKSKATIVTRVAEHRCKHFNVRECHCYAPHPEEAFDIFAASLLDPCANNGHEEVQPDQHVEIPKGNSGIVEIEEESVKLCCCFT